LHEGIHVQVLSLAGTPEYTPFETAMSRR
jgi:hypothetical protein